MQIDFGLDVYVNWLVRTILQYLVRRQLDDYFWARFERKFREFVNFSFLFCNWKFVISSYQSVIIRISSLSSSSTMYFVVLSTVANKRLSPNQGVRFYCLNHNNL